MFQNDIEVLTQEKDGVMDDIQHLINECDEIEVQVDAMRKGSGMSFWPIPKCTLRNLLLMLDAMYLS